MIYSERRTAAHAHGGETLPLSLELSEVTYLPMAITSFSIGSRPQAKLTCNNQVQHFPKSVNANPGIRIKVNRGINVFFQKGTVTNHAI